MPSPFPGMDPFIEPSGWESFHAAFVIDIADAIVPQVRPRYIVKPERRVYVESDPDDPYRFIRTDDVVLSGGESREKNVADAGQSVTVLAPFEIEIPMPQTHRETFLTVRETETLEVISVIEVLSPANKRPGSDGRRLYLEKRDAVLQSSAGLVEIDLLRGGDRLPAIDPLPEADYYAFVSRAGKRPVADVWAWTLRDRLPTIPIPLARGEQDAMIDLQEVFTSRYDRAGYDYTLNYQVELTPELRKDDAEWIRKLLSEVGPSR